MNLINSSSEVCLDLLLLDPLLLLVDVVHQATTSCNFLDFFLCRLSVNGDLLNFRAQVNVYFIFFLLANGVVLFIIAFLIRLCVVVLVVGVPQVRDVPNLFGLRLFLKEGSAVILLVFVEVGEVEAAFDVQFVFFNFIFGEHRLIVV